MERNLKWFLFVFVQRILLRDMERIHKPVKYTVRLFLAKCSFQYGFIDIVDIKLYITNFKISKYCSIN